MPLHIDYRPKDFSEVVGNKTTIETITNKIQGEDPPHAIMLHGPSGCGKTTIARIISDMLGCDTESNDFTELDIAQLTGVETAREIRQQMHFLPMESKSKCRVWLLDEFHRASKNFQDGMLKALEDTPEHVYFILCTTEPNKVIKTVQTRCIKFQVETLKDDQIREIIDWVLDNEQIAIEKDVIEEIIDVSNGCPRDALVTLDKIIDLEPKKMIDAIQEREVEKEIRELCQALLRGDEWNKLRKILKELKVPDAERARQAIIGYMREVALNSPAQAAQAALIFDCFREPLFYTQMSGLVFAVFNSMVEITELMDKIKS